MIMHLLNVKIGMTFSGGLIDYILFGLINPQTNAWIVIPVGLVFAVDLLLRIPICNSQV